jgi:hypothetical protein
MSEVNSILLDFSAKKIQRFFKNLIIIQNYNQFLNKFLDAHINLTECINLKKNIKKDLSIDIKDSDDIKKSVEVVDFGKFSKLIRQKDMILSTEKFINSIGGVKIKPNVLLTSLLLLFFQEDIVGEESQMNNIDKSLVEWVDEITDKIYNLKEEFKSSKFTNINLSILFNNFQIIFDQWKDYDKSKLIESILISYNNRCEHIEKIKSGNDDTIFKDLNIQSKEDMLNVLEEQKNDLLLQIKLTDPSLDIEYIKENSNDIIEQMTKSYEIMTNQVASTMKKAYFDMLCEEVESQNMLPIFDLIKDINSRLLIFVPQKNKKSFDSKFESNKIIDLLTCGDWSDELIGVINLMIDTVFVLGAPCDDKEMKEWKNYIMSLTTDNFSNNLPLILIQIQEKIDRIFYLLKELN